jgi:choline-glycine betaine transporter
VLLVSFAREKGVLLMTEPQSDGGWTLIFYMAWWTSWCGFVGLFIARISKGRTVPNVVLFSLFCPLIYSFIWFGVFGGVGLRQARQAMKLQKVGEDFLAIPTFSRLILQIVSTFLKRM